MILRNSRTGAALAVRVERASTVLGRMRGLLGRSGLPQGEALLLEPCASIHTLFIRFPIDAVFLSRELLVLGREEQALYDDTVGLLWVIHNFARIGVRAANVAAHTMFIIDRA